jgi:hypothetical protein
MVKAPVIKMGARQLAGVSTDSPEAAKVSDELGMIGRISMMIA